jgi:hypothetical protein
VSILKKFFVTDGEAKGASTLSNIVKYHTTPKKSMKNTLAYFGHHSDNVSMLKIFFITDGEAKGATTYCQISHYPEKSQ